MNTGKINSFVVSAAIVAVTVFCPFSVYRDASGFALGKNSVFAAVENAETKSDENVKSDKSADVTEKKDDPDGADNDTLYDYKRVEPEPTSTGWMFFKFFLIIALMLTGFYFFFRFVTKKAGISVVGRSTVDVISAVPVGQNKFIHIVDVAGKMLVLGVTDSNINLLTEITEKDQKDRIRLQSAKTPQAEKTTFQQYFESAAGFIGNVIKRTYELSSSARTGMHTDRLQMNKRNSSGMNMHDNDNFGEENMYSAMPDANLDDEQFSDYINEDKMKYLKKQKERLRRLNGFGDE